MMLVGVMYTAPWMATPEQLDERLPLGMAQWHEHVNFCGPRLKDVRSGKAKRDAASFARWLKITSEEECEAAGGRFVPRLFGWMDTPTSLPAPIPRPCGEVKGRGTCI